MKSVFLLIIKPNKMSGHIELAFDYKPTKEDILKVLKGKLEKVVNDGTKALFEKCIIGIDMYGVPSIGDKDEGNNQWKCKSESIYNSKGSTFIKRINLITK